MISSKRIVVLITFLVNTENVKIIAGWPTRTEFAVTGLVGAETLYRRIGPEVGYVRNDPHSESYETRLKVCTSILNSTLFSDYYDVVPVVDPRSEQIRKRVEENHPRIYATHYNASRATCGNFTNDYTNHRVAAKPPKDLAVEFAFVCLAEDRRRNAIVEYFITRDYDLGHDAIDENVMMWQASEARFVFAYTDGEPQPWLVALAERPALCHYAYQWQEKEEKPIAAIDQKQRKICRISPIDKVRLCTIMFTWEGFASMVRFCPAKDNIQPECVKKQITYYREFENFTHTGLTDNWSMVECKARNVRPNAVSEFQSFYVAWEDLSTSHYKFLIFEDQLSENITTLFGYFKTYLLEYRHVARPKEVYNY